MGNKEKLIAQTFDGAKVMDQKVKRSPSKSEESPQKSPPYPLPMSPDAATSQKACGQSEKSIDFFKNRRRISSYFKKSVESKSLEKNLLEEV